MNSTTARDANAREVFRLAATMHITRTNLGGRVKVDVGHYTYTVEIPPNHRAHIAYREAWGNTDSNDRRERPGGQGTPRRDGRPSLTVTKRGPVDRYPGPRNYTP